MATSAEAVVSVVMLGGSLWALRFLLPRARREHDWFAVVCALLVVLIGLLGWLFVGVEAW